MNLIQIELTNVCNLNCPFCYRKYMTREQGFMDLETFKKSLKLAKELKVKEVWLHNFGEPLLHSEVYNFVKLASKNFKVGFTTNGSSLSLDKLEQLKRNNLTFLDISLNMETNRFRVIHLIKYYIQANQLGIDCRFRCVVGSSAEYIYLRDFLSEYKVRWQRQMIRAKEPRTQKCLAKTKVMIVLWDGTVVPCCSVINKEIIYGKVGEELNTELNELENEYCKWCGEVNEEMPVGRKL